MQNSLDHYLEAADGAGKLMAHARLLLKLSHIYREIAPAHLARSSTLANYKSGTVIIHADSGAVAVKLRQLATTLADGFSKKGIECSGVQVKVQAPDNPDKSPQARQKPLSATTFHTLENLRDELPDDTLRQAIEHLLSRAAKTE